MNNHRQMLLTCYLQPVFHVKGGKYKRCRPRENRRNAEQTIVNRVRVRQRLREQRQRQRRRTKLEFNDKEEFK